MLGARGHRALLEHGPEWVLIPKGKFNAIYGLYR